MLPEGVCAPPLPGVITPAQPDATKVTEVPSPVSAENDASSVSTETGVQTAAVRRVIAYDPAYVRQVQSSPLDPSDPLKVARTKNKKDPKVPIRAVAASAELGQAPYLLSKPWATRVQRRLCSKSIRWILDKPQCTSVNALRDWLQPSKKRQVGEG